MTVEVSSACGGYCLILCGWNTSLHDPEAGQIGEPELLLDLELGYAAIDWHRVLALLSRGLGRAGIQILILDVSTPLLETVGGEAWNDLLMADMPALGIIHPKAVILDILRDSYSIYSSTLIAKVSNMLDPML